MKTTTLTEQELLFNKSAEGYSIPVDLELLQQIIEIAEDIEDVSDSDRRPYLKDFQELEIEYSDYSLIAYEGGY